MRLERFGVDELKANGGSEGKLKWTTKPQSPSELFIEISFVEILFGLVFNYFSFKLLDVALKHQVGEWKNKLRKPQKKHFNNELISFLFNVVKKLIDDYSNCKVKILQNLNYLRLWVLNLSYCWQIDCMN